VTDGEGEVVGCRKVGGAAGWRLAGWRLAASCRLAAAAANAVGLRLTV